MKNSQIIFDITLDKENIPEKIQWTATDSPTGEKPMESKAISLSLWDHKEKHSLRIDLWTKEMPVDEMKKFYIESIAGIGDSVLRSTNDEKMAAKIREFCNDLVEFLKKEESK